MKVGGGGGGSTPAVPLPLPPFLLQDQNRAYQGICAELLRLCLKISVAGLEGERFDNFSQCSVQLDVSGGFGFHLLSFDFVFWPISFQHTTAKSPYENFLSQ